MDDEEGYGLHVPGNRGREAMTYLTFIIDHYDALPKTMAFVHATNYQWHNDVPGGKNLKVMKNLRVDTVQKRGYVNLRCEVEPGCPTSVYPFNPTELDIKNNDVRAYFTDVYTELFNVTKNEVPSEIGAVCCGQFAVSRDRVLQRPRADYVRMRNWALKVPLDNKSIGWVYEKIWHIIFGEQAI